jgi:hypothetical protein
MDDRQGPVVKGRKILSQMGGAAKVGIHRGVPLFLFSPTSPFILGVAVGTLVAQRPPLRSVRAALPHTAPALGYNDKATD